MCFLSENADFELFWIIWVLESQLCSFNLLPEPSSRPFWFPFTPVLTQWIQKLLVQLLERVAGIKIKMSGNLVSSFTKYSLRMICKELYFHFLKKNSIPTFLETGSVSPSKSWTETTGPSYLRCFSFHWEGFFRRALDGRFKNQEDNKSSCLDPGLWGPPESTPGSVYEQCHIFTVASVSSPRFKPVRTEPEPQRTKRRAVRARRL